jgi:cytochrome c oxidase subunit III
MLRQEAPLSTVTSMGKLVPYRSPATQEEWTASIGMIVFLASWGMMFGALFFSYGIVRAGAPFWPPPDLPTLPLALPAINTVALGLSSFALHFGLRSVATQRTRRAAHSILVAAVLGAMFLALQLVVWLGVYDDGLTPKTGTYASVFYALTTFHALHVLIGVGALAWLAWGAYRGRYGAARHLPIRLWTMYWHFVGVVWGIMFATLYVF